MIHRLYLASPYTSNSKKVRKERFEKNCRAAALLMLSGHLVYAPVVYGHSLIKYNIPTEFNFWRSHCLSILLSWATGFVILPLDGWRQSRGLAAEWKMSMKYNLPCFIFEENGELASCPSSPIHDVAFGTPHPKGMDFRRYRFRMRYSLQNVPVDDVKGRWENRDV